MTYLLEGMRSLVIVGWDASVLAEAVLAVVAVGAISMTMCFAALRGRIKRG
jgi:ABC-2 type transport system permease protein